MIKTAAAFALLLTIVSSSASAETLTGRARVLDGDTVAVGGVTVRLKGIAAPERSEPGGEAARAFLIDLAQGKTLVCELTHERTHGRRVGICRLNGQDIAEVEIRAGLARDCPRYSRGRYAEAEQTIAANLPIPTTADPADNASLTMPDDPSAHGRREHLPRIL